MKKKVLSLLLALCMLLSLVPATAFAEVDEYYHNDGIISHFSCSPTGVQYRLTTYVDGWPVYKGEEIHAHTATIYRLSSGTSVEVGKETATYDSNYPTTTATLSVTRDLTPGLYLFVATMTVDDGDDDDDQVTGCKVFEFAGAWQDSFTDLSEAYPANTYATWSDVHRIDQDTTDGVNYAPSVSLTTPGGASGFNGESNSRDLTVNLKGFVLGAYAGRARTVYQDQAVYSVKCGDDNCVDHDYLAYRNVYYQLASLSDIEVYMKAHTASDWVKVRSTEEGQYADASVPASFSDITWKFTNSVEETDTADANVNITLTFPAGMDVGNVDVKVVPNAEVHMTPWYWSNEIADSYTYGSAVTTGSVYKNSGAEKFTQTGCKCTATYQGNTSNTLTCEGDTAAASHTDFVTSEEYTLAVYPNRVAVSGVRYDAKYTEIPKPTNEKLDLTYTGGANPQSHFVNYAGTAHAEAKKTLSSGSMSETGENWSWYPNNNWTGSSALAGYDIPAGTKNVLVLNNFYMEHDSTSGNATPVILPADTTIVLADGSVNKIVNTDSVVDSSKSIYCLGNLTIMGGGALTVEGNDYGIYATGDVTVKSGTVNVTAKSSAINAANNVNISGGIVLASGTDCGIAAASNTNISGGTVTATGKNGIYAYNDVNISGGTVTATANGANGDAINAGNNVIIASNSDVTASATKYGIYAKNDVILDGGTVEVESGLHAIIGMNSVKGSGTAEIAATSTDACGIVGYNGVVDLQAAKLTVDAKKDGVKAPSGDVKLDVADVTVKAQGSAVFAVKGSVTLKNLASGSDITSAGADAVWALNKVDVIDAEFAVKAAGYGIYASNSDVTVASGSDVTVTKAGADGICGVNVAVTDSEVTVTKAGADGICGVNVAVTDSEVTVTEAGADGIYADNDVSIDDSSKVTVTEAGDDGIDANNVAIASSTVLVASATNRGIEADNGDVTINGSSNVTVGNAGDDGIFAKNNVSISGGCDVSVNSDDEGIIADTGSVTATVTNLDIEAGKDGIKARMGITVKATVATVTSLNTDAIFTFVGNVNIEADTLFVESENDDAIETDLGDVTVTVNDTGKIVASTTGIKAKNAATVKGAGALTIEAGADGIDAKAVVAEIKTLDIKADGEGIIADTGSVTATVTNLNVNAKADGIKAKTGITVKATSFVAGNIKSTGADSAVTIEANVATATSIEANKATLSKNVTVTGDVNAENVEIKAGADVKAENVTAIDGITVNNGAKLTVEQTASATNVAVKAGNGNTVLTANEVVAKEKLTVEGAYNNYVTATIGKATVDADTVTASETSMKGNANIKAKTADLGKFTADGTNNPKGFYVQNAQGYTTNALYWREDAGMKTSNSLVLNGVNGGKFVFAPAGFAYKPVVSYGGGGGAAPVVTVTSSMPMLRKGNTGDAVKTLQTKLNALGYNCGAVDGVFGNDTYNAVVKYQKAMGISVDGVVGKATWGKLGVTGTTVTVAATTSVTSTTTTSATSNMPMLRKGNTGDAVKTLQTKLNALGYNCGAVDGVFGTNTYNAVVKFQKDKSLSVDGVVGNQTWAKLG